MRMGRAVQAMHMGRASDAHGPCKRCTWAVPCKWRVMAPAQGVGSFAGRGLLRRAWADVHAMAMHGPRGRWQVAIWIVRRAQSRARAPCHLSGRASRANCTVLDCHGPCNMTHTPAARGGRRRPSQSQSCRTRVR